MFRRSEQIRYGEPGAARKADDTVIGVASLAETAFAEKKKQLASVSQSSVVEGRETFQPLSVFWPGVIAKRFHIPAAWWPFVAGGLPREAGIDSIVIPATGPNYVEEALLSAKFASASVPEAGEIIIATDLHPSTYGILPRKIRAVQVALPEEELFPTPVLMSKSAAFAP